MRRLFIVSLLFLWSAISSNAAACDEFLRGVVHRARPYTTPRFLQYWEILETARHRQTDPRNREFLDAPSRELYWWSRGMLDDFAKNTALRLQSGPYDPVHRDRSERVLATITELRARQAVSSHELVRLLPDLAKIMSFPHQALPLPGHWVAFLERDLETLIPLEAYLYPTDGNLTIWDFLIPRALNTYPLQLSYRPLMLDLPTLWQPDSILRHDIYNHGEHLIRLEQVELAGLSAQQRVERLTARLEFAITLASGHRALASQFGPSRAEAYAIALFGFDHEFYLPFRPSAWLDLLAEFSVREPAHFFLRVEEGRLGDRSLLGPDVQAALRQGFKDLKEVTQRAAP